MTGIINIYFFPCVSVDQCFEPIKNIFNDKKNTHWLKWSHSEKGKTSTNIPVTSKKQQELLAWTMRTLQLKYRTTIRMYLHLDHIEDIEVHIMKILRSSVPPIYVPILPQQRHPPQNLQLKYYIALKTQIHIKKNITNISFLCNPHDSKHSSSGKEAEGCRGRA